VVLGGFVGLKFGNDGSEGVVSVDFPFVERLPVSDVIIGDFTGLALNDGFDDLWLVLDDSGKGAITVVFEISEPELFFLFSFSDGDFDGEGFVFAIEKALEC